jgi:hypothetical protein
MSSDFNVVTAIDGEQWKDIFNTFHGDLEEVTILRKNMGTIEP